LEAFDSRRRFDIRTPQRTGQRDPSKAKRPTGGRAYGYRDGKVTPAEAAVVREIFARFADGQSTHGIAAELNARRIPSPGSSWARSERRATGWLGSGVRVILRNERYRGVVHWNTSEWRKDPDTARRRRIERSRDEWITHHDESLRIVDDLLWQRVQARCSQIAEHSNGQNRQGSPNICSRNSCAARAAARTT
jgi:site-specific DNA recombinase